MTVSLIEVLGNDLTVVNAARVSFNNHHESFTNSDENLIKYLATHGHWTPFGHPQLQFRITAPIFVARQLVKHQVGLVWNEISRRYVDTDPVFLSPKEWREKSENKKQGSGEGTISLTFLEQRNIEQVQIDALRAYKMLISRNVAPEQARMVLPQSMYTEWYWTGSLAAFARVCNLRLSPDAQAETREVAQEISTAIEPNFPISWKHLIKNKEG